LLIARSQRKLEERKIKPAVMITSRIVSRRWASRVSEKKAWMPRAKTSSSVRERKAEKRTKAKKNKQVVVRNEKQMKRGKKIRLLL